MHGVFSLNEDDILDYFEEYRNQSINQLEQRTWVFRIRTYRFDMDKKFDKNKKLDFVIGTFFVFPVIFLAVRIRFIIRNPDRGTSTLYGYWIRITRLNLTFSHQQLYWLINWLIGLVRLTCWIWARTPVLSSLRTRSPRSRPCWRCPNLLENRPRSNGLLR